MTRCDKQLNFIPLAKNVLFRMRQKKLHQTIILEHNFLSYIDVIHTDQAKIIMIYFVQCTKHFKRKEENVGKNCFSNNILISAWHVFYEIPNGAQWSIKPISHYWDPLPRPGLSYYGKWQQGRQRTTPSFWKHRSRANKKIKMTQKVIKAHAQKVYSWFLLVGLFCQLRSNCLRFSTIFGWVEFYSSNLYNG